jgi:hypothetical protein
MGISFRWESPRMTDAASIDMVLIYLLSAIGYAVDPDSNVITKRTTIMTLFLFNNQSYQRSEYGVQ